MNYNAYIAHNLNEDEFESLSNYLASRLNGSEIISYANGRDGGKDGRRIGFSKNTHQWKNSGSKFIIQAKHTSDSNASCSHQRFFGNKRSIIAEEIDKIINLKSNNELEYYLLFTNRKYTGLKDSKIRKSISEAVGLDINNIEIFGIETINHLLNLSSNIDLVLQFNLHPNPSELKITDTVFLKSTVLILEDKPILLDNLTFDNINYIDRKFVKSNDENNIYYYGQTIEQIIEDEDFICILGNPGTGKTTTLKKIALDFWMDGEQIGYTPIYKSLKNFTANNTIENFLPEKHKDLPKIIFIFDGIDEIADIENFKCELNNFIQKNRETKNKEFKYIISCRSNIFNKEVFNLTEYKTYHIQDLSYNESISLLKQLCNSTLIDSLKFNSKLIDFIKTPLQVEVLASYINQHHQLSENVGLLWKDYISKRLTIDRQDKLANRPFNHLLIKKESTKIGFINELRNTLVIDEDSLLNVFRSDYTTFEEFVKNPLLNISNHKYSFENRNIQEYFAATALAKFSVQEIIHLIKVENLNVIQPNLLNTLTFLIDLVDTEKATELTSWLYNNQPEILFNSDGNRISRQHRVKIFQNYFNQICIEKALWIGDYSKIKEIARFGDCNENFDYLIEIIKTLKYHYRVSQSALSLLGYFNIQNKEDKLIKLFIGLLQNKSTELSTKEEILECIYNLKLTKYQPTLLSKIFILFKNTDKDSTSYKKLQLLSLEDNVNQYFDFIRDEFLKDNGIKERTYRSEIKNGSIGFILDKLILKIDNGFYFLSIIKYYFTKSHRIYSKLNETFVKKVIDTINKDKDLIIVFYEKIKDDYRFFNKNNRDIIIRITQETNTTDTLCIHIANKFPSDEDFNISFLLNENNLNNVINIITHKIVETEKIERLRNNIRWVNSVELANKFNLLANKKGINFNQPVFTKSDEEKQRLKIKKHNQDNFDILFNNTKLLKKLKDIFDKNNNQISRNNYWGIEEKYWNRKGNMHLSRNTFLDIIHYILHYKIKDSQNYIDYKFCEKIILENDYIIIKHIKELIDGNEQNLGFIIKEEQIEFIQKWCDKESKLIDFNNVWTLNSKTSYFFSNDNYYKIKCVLFFKKHLNITLSQNFIINSTQFYIAENSGENEFDEIKSWVNNKSILNTHIIQKLKENNLPSIAEFHYINHAIKNSLSEVTNEIKLYFLQDSHINSENFQMFISNFKLENSLKEYCLDENMGCTWVALKILLEQDLINKEYCSNIALAYIKADKIKFESNAFKILIKINHPYVLEYLKSILENNQVVRIERRDFLESEHYTFYKNNQIIIQLYTLIYKREWKNFRDIYYIKNFFKKYIQNLSKQKEYFYHLKNVFDKLIEVSNSKDDLFHINNLIDESTNSYVSSLSKPMSSDEAISYVDKI